MPRRSLISRLLVLPFIACSFLVSAQPGTSGSTKSMSAALANQRAFDAETAASIATSGAALYGLDSVKREWGQYCASALVLADRGEFRLAVREASKALHLGLTNGNRKAVAFAQRDLAYVYDLAGDLERSSMWADAALKSSLEFKGTRNFDASNELLSPIYKTLGDIEVRRGNLDIARNHYASARSEAGMFSKSKPLIVLAQAQLELLSGNPKVARQLFEDNRNGDFAPLALRGLAEVALFSQLPDEAAKFFEEAAKRADKDPYQRMWAKFGSAKLRATTDPKAARADFDTAIAAAEVLRGEFRSIEVRSGFFGSVQDLFDDAVGFGMRNNLQEWALEVSEKSRARATLDQIRGTGGNAQLAQSSSSTLDAQRLRAWVPKGAVLVVYHITRDATFAWTVTAERIVGYELGVTPLALAAKVAKLREAIIKFQQVDALTTSKSLYADLIHPLSLPKANVLFVAPHQSLHLLPFGALHSGERYLIEETAVATHLSATAFVESVAIENLGADKFLAFGNPDRGDPAEDLPGAEQEVRAISARFENPDIFLRGNATRSKLLQLAAKASVVHIASHASVDDIDPMYSRIHLAKPLGLPGDVEAHEILRLNLKQVSLVALSACNSGLGRVAAGEEFLGFKRTFAAAGVRRLLVSLWPVADDSTAKTMETFYSMRATTTNAEALRMAQLQLLRDPVTADPFFWAPFVLMGDYR